MASDIQVDIKFRVNFNSKVDFNTRVYSNPASWGLRLWLRLRFKRGTKKILTRKLCYKLVLFRVFLREDAVKVGWQIPLIRLLLDSPHFQYLLPAQLFLLFLFTFGLFLFCWYLASWMVCSWCFWRIWWRSSCRLLFPSISSSWFQQFQSAQKNETLW